MDFEDSPEEAAFRAEVRAWLDANFLPNPSGRESVSIFSEDGDEAELLAHAVEWQRRLSDNDWAAISWPPEYGGRGASLAETLVFQEELSRVGVPQRFFAIGLMMIGPTLIAHGTDEQKTRYLPPMASGEEIWCQLWSEPSAGSDLASLTTRAERDPASGDFVLNGQKVWTSGAHYATFGLGIFRTQPDAPKREGISALIVDMSTPGITVRPLRQMTGGSNFNEVFFDDAVVPAANLVGSLNDGWRVARTTMMNERMAVGGAGSPSAAFRALAHLATVTKRGDSALVDDPVIRHELATVFTLGRLFDLTYARVRTSLSRNAIPGPESSVLKLAAGHCWGAQADLAMRVLGVAGTLDGSDAPEGGRWQQALLGAPAVRIGGGTDSIQRNIIGEQVLGLPREPAGGGLRLPPGEGGR